MIFPGTREMCRLATGVVHPSCPDVVGIRVWFCKMAIMKVLGIHNFIFGQPKSAKDTLN
jgi:hypothetical protein